MITDKIMIMGAMKDVELNLILDYLKDIRIHVEATYTFYEGKLYDKDIVVCHTGIGTINAAVATFIGIKKYNPTAIFVIGTAGAHSEELHNEDLVVATSVLDLNSLNYEIKTLKSSEALIELMKKHCQTSTFYTYFGVVGSGDVWNKDTLKIKELNKKYGTLCEEMESIGVYEIAHKYNVPVITIRIISNNEITGEEYDRRVGEGVQSDLMMFLMSLNK